MMKAVSWLGLVLIIAFLFDVQAFSTTPSANNNDNNKHPSSSSWKDFYKASELRYVQLQSDTQKQLQTLQEQLDESIIQRDAALAKVETTRQQFLTDIQDLQDERDRLELRWAEECENTQFQLNQLQQLHTKEMKQARDTLQRELQETKRTYEAKWNATQQQMESLQMMIRNQRKEMEHNSVCIQRLEKERRSFRSLLGLAWQLGKRRVVHGIQWVSSSARMTTTNGARKSKQRRTPAMMVDEEALLMAARRYTNGGMP